MLDLEFIDAQFLIVNPLAMTVFDETHSQNEERWFTLEMSNDGKLLAVSHTYQPARPSSAQVRIISARAATRSEQKQYGSERIATRVHAKSAHLIPQ